MVPPYLLWAWVRHWLLIKTPPLPLGLVDNSLVAGDFWISRLTAVKIVGKYLGLLLWPRTLCGDYSFNQIPLVQMTLSHWEDWKCVLGLVGILSAIVLAVRQLQRQRALAFFILFFFSICRIRLFQSRVARAAGAKARTWRGSRELMEIFGGAG